VGLVKMSAIKRIPPVAEFFETNLAKNKPKWSMSFISFGGAIFLFGGDKAPQAYAWLRRWLCGMDLLEVDTVIAISAVFKTL